MITPEVERGIALLDERVPGWRDRINLDDLDMGSITKCVLGQLFGQYVDGLNELFGDRYTFFDGAHYGFTTIAGSFASFGALTERWYTALR